MTNRPAPTFIGGTGRSGTHILGRLLDRHPEVSSVPIEARFHCNKRGMPDLLGGRISLHGFLKKLHEFWWHRVRVDDQPRGLYNLMTHASFEASSDTFQAAYRDNPVGACRQLFWDLLGPWADGAGKPRLVEMSSHNVREAQTLRRLFSSAVFVHAVRDGRDAASSVTTKTWGPDDVISGIGWWAERLRAIDAGVNAAEDGAEFTLPPDRLCVILLEDLVAGERNATYSRLLSHLRISDAPAMREFFETTMSATSANTGRWAKGLGWFGRRRVRWVYERTLSDLQMQGNHVAAPLIAAYERDG